MRLPPLLALLLALGLSAPVVVPMQSFAQSSEIPPLPRPRPDPDAVSAPTTGGTEATSAASQAIETLTTTPQPVILNATITQGGELITEGLTWRVFESLPDANGEIAMVAKAERGTATLEIPPGEYVVHVAYGRAQASEPLSVLVGSNEKTFVLDAGALRLNAAVVGDIPIPSNLLKFDIYSGNEEGRILLAENASPNEIITLNSGTFHIVSKFGTINATVRADLKIEAGQLTDATLYQRASQVSFKLVSEAGGEAIADVDWTVTTPEGTTLFTELGAFPATVLGEGEYVVIAKQGVQVFNRDFEVLPGASKEIEVLTSVY
jgi:hypothetical protein